MRVLFSSHAGSGHFHPLVPTARALQKAGHEVAFAVPEAFRPTVDANGFRSFSAGIGFEQLFGGGPSEAMQRQKMMMSAPPAQRQEFMAKMFIDGFARNKVPALLAICEEWKPDLLIRESMEPGGSFVGEKLGLPHASIQVGGNMSAMFNEGGADSVFLQRLTAYRAELGLKSDPGLGRQSPNELNLAFMPPSFYGEGMPATTRYLKADVFDQSGKEGLPEWVSTLGKRPLIYATLGTAFNKLVHHLGTIAQGLREEPVELIITVGRDMDPAVLGPQPAHVHVERYIPQSLLLPRCDLAIIHGGYSSVMSAIYSGVPAIVVPLGADQPMNAQTVERIGLGRMVSAETLTPEIIRSQVREVLADGAYRERAQRLRAEAQALPGLDQGVALLEKLARDKTPSAVN